MTDTPPAKSSVNPYESPASSPRRRPVPCVVPLVIRGVLLVAVVTAIVQLLSNHGHGGMKGIAIPLENVFICMACACVAAFICKRLWIGIAVPFVAGIAGVFGIAGQFYGPYGGAIGFLVGCVVFLIPVGCRSKPANEDAPTS